MIHISATVKGEPDTDPFTQTFIYVDKSDEQIFYDSVGMINDKLDKNLKINLNESIMIYCEYIVKKVRDRKAVRVIEKSAQKILRADKVMIGVPETLRRIIFEVRIDKLPKRHIILKEPIPTSDYILAARK